MYCMTDTNSDEDGEDGYIRSCDDELERVGERLENWDIDQWREYLKENADEVAEVIHPRDDTAEEDEADDDQLSLQNWTPDEEIDREAFANRLREDMKAKL